VECDDHPLPPVDIVADPFELFARHHERLHEFVLLIRFEDSRHALQRRRQELAACDEDGASPFGGELLDLVVEVALEGREVRHCAE
jgi:hypothetical protein